MKGPIRYSFLFIPLLLMTLCILPVQAGILVQCPTDTNGDGVSDDPNVICLHLSSGDGFTKMADGKDQYIFSFAEIPPATPITDVVASFTGRAMFISIFPAMSMHHPTPVHPATFTPTAAATPVCMEPRAGSSSSPDVWANGSPCATPEPSPSSKGRVTIAPST